MTFWSNLTSKNSSFTSFVMPVKVPLASVYLPVRHQQPKEPPLCSQQNPNLHRIKTRNPSEIGAVCYEYCVTNNKSHSRSSWKLRLYPRLYAYSDSTIALSWVKSQPYRFQNFVTNGVVTIQQISSPELWYQVPTMQNPAGLATHPIGSKLLLDMSLWWNGPIC